MVGRMIRHYYLIIALLFVPTVLGSFLAWYLRDLIYRIRVWRAGRTLTSPILWFARPIIVAIVLVALLAKLSVTLVSA